MTSFEPLGSAQPESEVPAAAPAGAPASWAAPSSSSLGAAPSPPSQPWATVEETSSTQGRASAGDVAKDQAASVASGAADAAGNVAEVAKEQVGQVVAEGGRQVRQLMGQAQSELSEQAGQQQQRAAAGLHVLGDQLASMAEASDSQGAVTDLAQQAADKSHQVAAWLEERDPGSVLNEVRAFARHRPGVFLALALGAGVLAGRLARGLSADPEDKEPASSVSARRPSPAALTQPPSPAILPGAGTAAGTSGALPAEPAIGGTSAFGSYETASERGGQDLIAGADEGER